MSVEILIRADSFQDSMSHPRRQINEVELIHDDYDDDDAEGGNEGSIWKKSKFSLTRNLFILALACMAMQTAFLINNSSDPKQQRKIINFHHIARTLTANTYVYLQWVLVGLEKFIKIFDCFILPQYLIKKLGTKSTIFISFFTYLLFYMTTKFYPLTYASYLGVFLNEC